MPQVGLHFISLVLVTLSLTLSLYGLHVEWHLREDAMEENRFMTLLHMRRQMRKFSSPDYSLGEKSRNISALPHHHRDGGDNDDDNNNNNNNNKIPRGKEEWMKGGGVGGRPKGKTNIPGLVKGGRGRGVETGGKGKGEGGGGGGGGGGGFLYHPACDWTPRLSCSSLFKSRYARVSQFIRIPFTSFHLPPIPNSAFAFFLYLLEMGCFFFTEGYYALTILVMIGTVGLGTLVTIMRPNVTCPIYVGLYLLNALSFWAARRRWIHWKMEEINDDEASSEAATSGSSPSLSKGKKEEEGKKGLSAPPARHPHQQQEEEEEEKVRKRKKNDELVSSPEDSEEDDEGERNWEEDKEGGAEYVRRRR